MQIKEGLPPIRLIEEIFATREIIEPSDYNEATSSSETQHWLKAMEDEINSLKENGIWILCDLPEVRKAIGSKWIFKIKRNTDGSDERF